MGIGRCTGSAATDAAAAKIVIVPLLPLGPSPRIRFGLGFGGLGLHGLVQLNSRLFDVIECGVTRLIKVARSTIFGSCALGIPRCGLSQRNPDLVLADRFLVTLKTAAAASTAEHCLHVQSVNVQGRSALLGCLAVLLRSHETRRTVAVQDSVKATTRI